MMQYQIVLQQTEEGVSVSAPELPGCHSQGVDVEDAIRNISEGISEYLVVATGSEK